MNTAGYAIVRLADFIQPVLAARDDFFDTYVLLQDNVQDGDHSRQQQILYLDSKLSSSFGLSVDSALALQKNSDLGDISELNIGGEVYTFFFRPFSLAGSKLALGGLIRKGEYDRQVKTLPAGFVVAMILVIFLGLIILPFLKVFLLSPRENVHKWDVLGIVLSTFLGSGVFVLAGVYFLADFSAQSRVEDNLKNLSDELEGDIRRDMQAAGEQLNAYIGEYKNLGPGGLAGVVAYQDFDSNHKWVVDKLFTPTSYPLVARLIWFDSAGNTTAKWNPFTFLSPPSPMKGYDFFLRLKQKNKGDEAMVFSAGKSNITGEFQLSLSRLDSQSIFPSAVDTGKSVTRKPNGFAVVMPFYLNSGLHPVLPKGYGFCLVNKKMNVLMHSDARRNLAEDFYKETGENAGVRNAMDLKKERVIGGVDLYGSPHTLYVRPVIGEGISLVVFYDNDTHAENIFRMIHFGAETLLYLALLFFVCLFLSVASWTQPSKLSCTIDLGGMGAAHPAQQEVIRVHRMVLHFFTGDQLLFLCGAMDWPAGYPDRFLYRPVAAFFRFMGFCCQPQTGRSVVFGRLACVAECTHWGRPGKMADSGGCCLYSGGKIFVGGRPRPRAVESADLPVVVRRKNGSWPPRVCCGDPIPTVGHCGPVGMVLPYLSSSAAVGKGREFLA